MKPLPKINPKDKGKSVLEDEPEKKKVKPKTQVELDAEVAHQYHLEEVAEMERLNKERKQQEQSSQEAIAKLYDEVQARMDADHELAVRWSKEEEEKFSKDQRAKLLAEYFENRKKLLNEERVFIEKLPTRTQLRSLMMTYLKHSGRYKHSQLNKNT